MQYDAGRTRAIQVPHSPVPDTQVMRIVTVRKIKRMQTGKANARTIRFIRNTLYSCRCRIGHITSQHRSWVGGWEAEEDLARNGLLRSERQSRAGRCEFKYAPAAAIPRAYPAYLRSQSASLPAASSTCRRKSRIPQSGQNQAVTVFPLSAIRLKACGAPAVSRNASGGTTKPIAKALPLKRWHSVQWQAKMAAGAAVISYRTVPH